MSPRGAVARREARALLQHRMMDATETGTRRGGFAWTALGAFLAALAAGCAEVKRFAYEGLWRDRWQKPELVVRVLDLRPGDRVADLGAGGGYFTFRLADAVGPGGKVYAVDLDENMVGYLRDRAAREGRGNVEAIAATADDPRLPEPVDVVLTVDTYHHLADRPAYFARLREHLRPGGRVAVIDYRGDAGLLARLFGHATSGDVIRRDLEAAGYRLTHDHGFLPRQSFLVFQVGTV